MTSPSLLRVALPVPLPRGFDYLPPAGHVASGADIGKRARVPFGNRELVGVVEAVVASSPAPAHAVAPGDRGAPASVEGGLRQILALLDETPLLHGELLDSLRWLARYTHAPLGETLATALPKSLRAGEPLDGKRKRKKTFPAPSTQPLAQAEREQPKPNPEQQAAIDAIGNVHGFHAFLLDGVTGSGKTEVYLHAIGECLARGRQALVLVPEIGLTPQTLARFRARLGVEIFALHSGLSDGERARAWVAAARGEARVIVGTRSAAFVPLPEAGLIVIDEEHDASYKQLDGIRYHARDFALVRGKALDVPVVLGSATPSLESLHNAQAGRYTHLRLHRRAGEAAPPGVRVIDVRKRPLHAGLSQDMLDQIGSTLQRGEQVLVFKNRRGYAPVLICHDCGWSAHCKRCDAPMTVHAQGKRLQCHHCGQRQPAPNACPDCGGLALQPQGVGTERLEELLAEKFGGQFPVLRIDRSTTQRKDALGHHLESLGNQAGVLVGTQILAKGHDLPNLTLVVVVGVDEGLFSADFRSGEKLAQQLIQVAGRAGRARKRGEVRLQTHHPNHPLLHTLIHGGYHAFAEEELAQREHAGFPPFAHLALIRAEAKHLDAVDDFLAAAKAQFATAHIELHGPMPAPMPRRAGFRRMQLLLSSPTRRALHSALDAAIPKLHELPAARKVRWSLDVDPVDLY